MKNKTKLVIFILSLLLIPLIGKSEEVTFIQTSVGVGKSEDIYATAKIHSLKIHGTFDKTSSVSVFGIGVSTGSLGVVFSPVQVEFNNVGVSLDFSIGKKKGDGGISLNYSF